MSRPQESLRRAQDTIQLLHTELEQTNREVLALTLELEQRVDALGVEVAERKKAESERQAQVERLNLLNQITHAIGERQDLRSILQVAVRSLEDNLPLDFVCVCMQHAPDETLSVTSVGFHCQPLARTLSLCEQSTVLADEHGLPPCLRGELVCEPDTRRWSAPFAKRLAEAGLGALIIAPLRAESAVFGVIIAARREPNSFSNTDREFLRQVSEHVALAVHQAQLYDALRRAYDDLRQTQQAVMQQERLRVLGQMASGIAHDINNAISPVALYVESLLEREPNLSARGRDYLQVVQRSVEAVASTVARLREFYRPREQEEVLTSVNINSVIKRVVTLTRARWCDLPQQRGLVIDLRMELEAQLPDIRGVESEIRDALTNLIINAVDAMPEGGALTLKTLLVAANGSDEPKASPPQVIVEVIDSGIGMDEETRRRCLEPFYTTKGERGTGLGLAMVYGMVKRHGGEIEIESTAGKGSTLRLIFSAAHSERTSVVYSRTREAPAQRLNVLVIDDDPTIVSSLQNILEDDGHTVTVADGGQRGIDLFSGAHSQGRFFDVVITDLGMPHVEGRKVAASVKAVSPATPVVLLTGWGRRMLAESEIPPHVDRVLSKPPRLQDIRSALAELTSSKL